MPELILIMAQVAAALVALAASLVVVLALVDLKIFLIHFSAVVEDLLIQMPLVKDQIYNIQSIYPSKKQSLE